MQIAPIISNVFNFKKTNSRNKITYSNYPVSFKNTPPILKSELNNLNETIKELDPFLKDSRDLYIETGKIGYRAQEAMNLFTLKENELMNRKFSLKNSKDNPLHPAAAKFFELANENDNNLRNFENIKRLSKLPMYENSILQEKIDNAEKGVFSQNSEFEKIKPLSSFIKNTYEQIDDKFEKINIRDDKELFKKFKNAKEQFTSAGYFMFVTPYNEAVKLKIRRDEIKSMIENPSINLHSKLKIIENAQKSAEKIIKDTELFYKNRDEMEKFVDETKTQLPPSSDEIIDAYEKMTHKCNDIFTNHIKKANDFYNEKFNRRDINTFEAEKTLYHQKKTNDELYKLIDKLKTDFFSSKNEEFYKQWDFNE